MFALPRLKTLFFDRDSRILNLIKTLSSQEIVSYTEVVNIKKIVIMAKQNFNELRL